MCKSANEPGGPRRCRGHLNQKLYAKVAKLNRIERGEIRYKNADEGEIKTKVLRSEIDLLRQESVQLREMEVSNELARQEREKRMEEQRVSRASRGEMVKSGKTSVSLTGAEFSRLEEEAREERQTLTQLLRKRLADGPAWKNRPATTFVPSKGQIVRRGSSTVVGRPRSSADEKRQKRLNLDLSPVELNRLDSKAQSLGITTSDLIRSILHKNDPREYRRHNSERANERSTHKQTRLEQELFEGRGETGGRDIKTELQTWWGEPSDWLGGGDDFIGSKI